MEKEKLLDDTIEIVALNREGKFFESVIRADAESKNYDIKIQVDINTDIYPVEIKNVQCLLHGIELLVLHCKDFELGRSRR